jgi:diguanylate cyclase (GGDEF)-like protein
MPAQTELDVLLADPQEDRREAAAATLRAVGWNVMLCGTAEEAVDACRAKPPAVLVIDVDAGTVGEGCVIDAIKRDPDLFAIGVVVRGRELGVDSAMDNLTRGADGLLVDPVAEAELVAAVRSAARVRALREELRSRADDLERLAFFDSLTDLPNRRFLDRQLAALISGAGRHGRPLAAVLLDIDRFKAINDSHGHATGDAVIAGVAARLAGRLRAEDHLGRFGGEEFLVLLPDTGPEAAAGVAEDLRAAVESAPFDSPAGALGVTISGGWSVWEGEAPHELIARADAGLYEAKNAGRNCVMNARDVPRFTRK